MLTKINAIVILLVFLLHINFCSFSQIQIDSLLKYAIFLSDIDKKGRLPGTVEYDLCANYVIEHFQRNNIKPFVSYPDYKQRLDIPANIFHACDFYFILPDNNTFKPIQGINYSFRGFTGSSNNTFELIFCGFGIETPEYNDFSGIDIQGKAVIIFKENPPFDINYPIKPFSVRERALNAYKKGANALIFVYPSYQVRNKPIGSTQCAEGEYLPNFPLLEIDSACFNMLLKEHNTSAQQVYEKILKSKKPYSLSFKTKAYINVQTTYFPNTLSYNIMGYLEGSDYLLKHQYIILTAHMDHVGAQCSVIYPGANDNASGVAALMELARILSNSPPKRSIIFVIFTGEESGLIGSNYFSANLPVDNDQIIAAFNLDCIAVGDSIQIGNGLSAPILYEICRSYDFESLIVKNTWKGGGADLTPLHNIGIPGLYFVSKYSYKHLHLPSDLVDTFNTKLFLSIVKLAYLTIKGLDDKNYSREKIFY